MTLHVILLNAYFPLIKVKLNGIESVKLAYWDPGATYDLQVSIIEIPISLICDCSQH